jgi:hypothetical protein
VKGAGNQQDYGMRIYDPRLGRFLSVDPLTKTYPMLTPYQFASNTPIAAIDLDGLEGVIPTYGMEYNTPKHYTAEQVANRYQTVAAMKIGAGLGALAGADLIFNQGRATTFLFTSVPLASVMEHNRAKTPEGRKAQDERSKEALTNVVVGWGLSNVFKTLGSTISFIRGNSKLWLNSGIGLGSDMATLKSFANLKPKKGWFDVVIHGDKSAPGVLAVLDDNPINAQGLYSFMLKNGYNGTDKIRLISCNAATGGKSSLAQELSNIANVDVIAPAAKTKVAELGKLITEDGSKYIPFRPLKQ